MFSGLRGVIWEVSYGMMNFLPDIHVKKVISVFTVPASIGFAEETVFLGEDFMDKYEAPEIHRQNEQIKD